MNKEEKNKIQRLRQDVFMMVVVFGVIPSKVKIHVLHNLLKKMKWYQDVTLDDLTSLIAQSSNIASPHHLKIEGEYLYYH
jgi:hypothetical protein